MTSEDESLSGGGGGTAGVSEQLEDKRAAAEPGDLPGGTAAQGKGRMRGLGVVPKDSHQRGAILPPSLVAPSPSGGVPSLPGPPTALRSRVPGERRWVAGAQSKDAPNLGASCPALASRFTSDRFLFSLLPHPPNQGKESTVLFLILIGCPSFIPGIYTFGGYLGEGEYTRLSQE